MLAAVMASAVVAAGLLAWPRDQAEVPNPAPVSEERSARGETFRPQGAPAVPEAPRSEPTAPLPSLTVEDLSESSGLRERRRARFATEATDEAARLLAESDAAPLDSDLLAQARAVAATLRDPSAPPPR